MMIMWDACLVSDREELVADGVMIIYYYFFNIFKLPLIMFRKCSYRLITPYALRNSLISHNLGDSLFAQKVIFKK